MKSGGEGWLKVIWCLELEHISMSGNEERTEKMNHEAIILRAVIEYNCSVSFQWQQ